MLGTFSGGGLGFGVAFTLYDDFSRTAYHIERSLSRLGLNATHVNNRINQTMNQMAIGTGMLAAGLATLVPIGMGVQIAGEFEQAKFGLETLLKSKEKAEEMFAGIKEDAATSSFGVESLLWVNRALVSTGLGAEQARKDTMNLANAIAAVGGSNDHLNRMAINMQQIRNIGKANGLDIKQFGYAGINIYKLLEETTGLHIDQLKEMDITYEQIATALEHAAAAGGMYHGALAKQAGSILGLVEQISDRIKYFAAAMGEAVMPVVRPLLDFLIVAFEKLATFAETDIGRRIFQIIAAGSALLVLLGSLIIVMGFAQFSAYKLALAFGEVTRAQIFAALSAGNLSKAWKIMALSGLSSMGALLVVAAKIGVVLFLLYKAYQFINDTSESTRQLGFALFFVLGPLGWLVGSIAGIIKGLSDFDGLLDNTTMRLYGISGFFQKLGGIIRGVQMIFETWGIAGANTFGLTYEMESALHRIGLLEFVIAVGTWIARLKAFFGGLIEGIKMAATYIKQISLDFINAFIPVGNKFESWDDLLNRNLDTLESWRNAGVIAGAVIGAVILALAVKFAIMGIAALWAMLPILAVIALIVVATWAAYKAIDWVIKKYDEWNSSFVEHTDSMDNRFSRFNDSFVRHCEEMDNAGWSMVNSLGRGFSQMFDSLDIGFGDLTNRAYDWGANFLTRFFDGIKSIGLGIADWFTNGPIGSALQGRVYHDTGDENQSNFNTKAAAFGKRSIERGMDNIAKAKAQPFASTSSNTSSGVGASKQPIVVNLQVDNETLFSKVLDMLDLNEGRK